MRTITLVLTLAIAVPASAGNKPLLKERKRDAFSEMNAKRGDARGNDAGLALRFFNALTGAPVSGATVTFDGQQAVTSADGRALLSWPKNLNRREDRRIAKFRRKGYVDSDIELHFMAGTIFSTRFSISPALDPKRMRVVMDWGARPADLDAHLIKRGNQGFHISYRKMKTYKDLARLDRDDTDAFGPETITVNRVDANGDYTFVIHDYTHRSQAHRADFRNAKATARVYLDGRLKAQFIPPVGRGNLWEVFKLSRGQLKAINRIRSQR